MSRKQLIYPRLLTRAMLHLRASQCLAVERQLDADALFRLADLLHNMPDCTSRAEFDKRDFYFIGLEAGGCLADPQSTQVPWYELIHPIVQEMREAASEQGMTNGTLG